MRRGVIDALDGAMMSAASGCATVVISDGLSYHGNVLPPFYSEEEDIEVPYAQLRYKASFLFVVGGF